LRAYLPGGYSWMHCGGGGADPMRELFVMAVLTFALAALWLGSGWIIANYY
jgi:hypothetical protein